MAYVHYVGFRIELRKVRHTIKNFSFYFQQFRSKMQG